MGAGGPNRSPAALPALPRYQLGVLLISAPGTSLVTPYTKAGRFLKSSKVQDAIKHQLPDYV